MTITLSAPVLLGMLVAISFAYAFIFVLGEECKMNGAFALFVTFCIQAVFFLIVYGFMHLIGL